jgi:transposase-like protein
MESSGKRKTESFDTKLQIIDTVNAGSKSTKQITEEFGIAPTTLRTIWTNRDKILEARDFGDLSPKRKKKEFFFISHPCLIKERTPNKQRYSNHAVTLKLFYFVTLIKCKLLV